MSNPPTATETAGLPSDAEAIDQFLAAQAPQWLKGATLAQLNALHGSLREHARQQARLQQLLQRIQPLHSFCQPLLYQGLRALGVDLDVNQAIWREVRVKATSVLFPVYDVSPPSMSQVNEDSPLLSRALQNFTAGQGGRSSHFAGTGIHIDGLQAAVDPSQFADLCRSLDFGGQYQRHLDSILTPAQTSDLPLQLFAEERRTRLSIDAHMALLKGQIDDKVYRLLLQVCAGKVQLRFDDNDVRLRGLTLAGCRVHDALVLDVQDLPFVQAARTRELIVYLPGDPQRPLRRYPSWAQLSKALALELQAPEQQADWFRRLGLDDRRRLARILAQGPEQAGAQLRADWVVADLPLFTWLAQAHIARIKADAASLAVPTAAVDQAAYRARLQAYEEAGLNLFGMLVSFLPGVGEVMLAMTLVQVLGEVYEGVEDWRHGQREQAMEHLFGVLHNLAVTTVVAAGGVAAYKLLPRSGFVDKLVPVLRDDGEGRLWNLDLEPYRATAARAPQAIAEDGLSHTGEQRWLQHEGHLYQVEQHPRAGHWRLRHPQRPRAYAPRVEHNGEAVWLMPGEQPLHWQGLGLLLRRCGPWARTLAEADCVQIAQIAGIDEAQLRGLLVDRHRLPTNLRDALQQVALDHRVSDFLAQLTPTVTEAQLDPELFQRALALLGEPFAGAPANNLVRLRAGAPTLGGELFAYLLAEAEPRLDGTALLIKRDFPGLPAAYAQALAEQVSAGQELFMATHQRLPLDLAEQARLTLREARLTRALLGLKLRHGYFEDGARLAMALLRRNPAWSFGLSLELREGSAFGRLIERQLALAETRSVRVLVGDSAGFAAYTEEGYEIDEEIPAPAGFFEAVYTCLNPQQRQALGSAAGPQQLRELLLGQALAQRERCGPLFGLLRVKPLFKPWELLPDGRRGYPMGGLRSGNRRSLRDIVRSLFPSFDDDQADGFLNELRVSDGNVIAGLLRFQHQRQSLDVALTQWTRQAGATSSYVRHTFSSVVSRCWRRGGQQVVWPDGREMGYSLSASAYLCDLPAIPANISFAHVVSLTLSNANLAGDIQPFLQAFTQLRWLTLVRSQLRDIPQAVTRMPALTRLYLSHNQIQISAAGAQHLASLGRLEVLSLDHNPLGARLDLNGLPALREVYLRGAQLPGLPAGLESLGQLRVADLRHNNIQELPETYYSAPQRLRELIILQHNPFSEATLERLRRLAVRLNQQRLQAAFDEGLRRWSIGLEEPQLSSRHRLWAQLQDEPGAHDLLRLLTELTETAEFAQAPGFLAGRVWRMLEAVHENTALREELFDMAGHPASCSDGVGFIFSNLEVRLELYHVLARANSADARPVLLQFARQLFRLEQVERIAKLDIDSRLAAGQEVDEVEVNLGYRIGLARELALPGQPTYLRFTNLANIAEARLNAAAQAVRQAEAGPALLPFVSTRTFWREHLRQTHAVQFGTLEQGFWTQLDALEEQRASLAEGDYLQRANQLAAAREAALDALFETLTRQILEQR